jgi:Protein of unknown function (DUF3455)
MPSHPPAAQLGACVRARRHVRKQSLVLSLLSPGAALAQIPDEIAAKDEQVLFQVHAIGVQVYECKADDVGKTTWQFREPIAALWRDDKNVGKHYAGPTWEIGGSAIVGKVVAHSPGETSKDIPWLKLDVADRRGDGPLREAATIQRLNTKGGNYAGPCDSPGALHGELYSADYVFLKKAP